MKPKRLAAEKSRKRTKRLWLVVIWILVISGALLFIVYKKSASPIKKYEVLCRNSGVRKPNVILITLDTLRADRLPGYGYKNNKLPTLDRLGGQGIIFFQCTTVSPLTLPAHCSIMTGTYPTFHGVRVNGNAALSEEQTTLAELFKQAGYTTGAFIGAFVLDGRWGLRQGFDHYDDNFDLRNYKQIDLGAVQRPANEIIDLTLDWLERTRNNPFFAWIHLYDPHLPYSPPEPYYSQYGPTPSGLYDGEIAFMDEQLGRLVSWLEHTGLKKNTVLILVGDHGEGLGDHGEYAHGYYIYDYAVQVPLIIVTPFESLKGIHVRNQVSVADVFPTTLELARLKVSSKSQGESLLPLIFAPRQDTHRLVYSESFSPNIHYGWSPLRSLRNGSYKYIMAPRPELYNIVEDHEEINNLYASLPRLADKMSKELEALISKISQGAVEPSVANLDKDTVERLAALGYVGAPTSLRTRAKLDKELADPKDKLQVYNFVQQAGELVNLNKYEEAYALLEQAVRQEPGIPQAHLLLATCAGELGKKEEAKANLDLILKEDASNLQALIAMANLLMAEGKNEDVLAICRRALSIDEQNVQAYTIMGEVYMSAQDHRQALPYLEKAVEIQPKLTQNKLNLGICFLGLKDYERAEKLLREVMADYPKFPLLHFHLGLLNEEKGNIQEALTLYQEEIKINPGAFRARFNLGRLKLKMGDLTGYLEEMREVVRLAPKMAEGYLFLARGLIMINSPDLKEIMNLIRKGLELARTSELKALAYFLLADVYSRMGDVRSLEEARRQGNYYKNLKELEK